MQRYEGRLVSFAAHITGSRERARDVVQDTFAKLCQADRQQVEDRLTAWLFTVCRNRALDVSTKEGRMRYPGDERLEARPNPAPSPATVAEARQELGRALEALATLTERQQEVVRLKLHGGLSYREIAEVTGTTANNVGVTLHTALCALRQAVARSGGGRLS